MAGPEIPIPSVGLHDQALVRRVRDGDESAFAGIVRRYEAQLTRFAVKLVSNSADAEDVVQDAFLRAYLALRRDQRPINLAPWLHTITRNCAIDLVRRPIHGALTSEPVCPTSTSEAAETRARMGAVVTALGDLPARQRDPLVLHVLGDQPYAQIAKDQDLSVAAVKALISRARTQLRAGALGEAA
jgi:RNA polymerase sigma-70 factor (ECF subfamily)